MSRPEQCEAAVDFGDDSVNSLCRTLLDDTSNFLGEIKLLREKRNKLKIRVGVLKKELLDSENQNARLEDELQKKDDEEFQAEHGEISLEKANFGSEQHLYGSKLCHADEKNLLSNELPNVKSLRDVEATETTKQSKTTTMPVNDESAFVSKIESAAADFRTKRNDILKKAVQNLPSQATLQGYCNKDVVVYAPDSPEKISSICVLEDDLLISGSNAVYHFENENRWEKFKVGSPITCITAVDQREKLFAMGCSDGTLHTARINKLPEATYALHEGAILKIAHHPRTRLLYSIGIDMLWKIFDIETEKVVREQDTKADLGSIAVHPNGALFAIASTVGDFGLRIIDTRSKDKVFGVQAKAVDVSIRLNGTEFMYADGSDNSVNLCELRAAKPLLSHVITDADTRLTNARFDASGTVLMYTGPYFGIARFDKSGFHHVMKYCTQDSSTGGHEFVDFTAKDDLSKVFAYTKQEVSTFQKC